MRGETGLLKRLRASPLPAWVMVGGITGNALIVSALQVVVLLVIGRVAYDVPFPHAWPALVVALVVGAISFTALGVAVSTLIPDQESAGPVTSIVFFVLLFLSGLWYPLPPGSGLARFSAWFPVRRLIVAVFAPFDPRPGASPWAWGDLAVIAAWGVAASVVAVRRFRWAPRRA